MFKTTYVYQYIRNLIYKYVIDLCVLQGSVLSFVSIKEQELLKAVETHLQAKQSGESIFQ